MFLAGQRPTARQMNTIINTADLFLAPNFSCTTTTYADFTSASLVFEKLLPAANSDLRIWINVSGFLVASAPVNNTIGVNISGTDYDITLQRFNTAAVHQCWGRMRRITGIAAGSYTIQVRSKNDTASRTTTFTASGSGGQLGMVVEELLL
jgi:hypothetical protein